MEKINLFGIKPTRIHIGHIFSMFKNIDKHKDIAKILLIGDYHKFSSEINDNKITELVENIKRFSVVYFSNYYIQSHYNDIYMSVLMKFFYFSNIKDINKIFLINYNNMKQNTVSFIYPILMAVDIYLCSPCVVTISCDQKHNIRAIKKILNTIETHYKLNIDVQFDILNIKILDLYSPFKMSTSSNKGIIYFDDSKEEIINKIMKSKTQSLNSLNINDLGLNTKNLYMIYSYLTEYPLQDIVTKYASEGFYNFKNDLIKKLICKFDFIKEKIKEGNPKQINMRERFLFNLKRIQIK